MVGCGDHHRANVRPVQHGPEVLDPSHIGGNFRHARNALPQAGKPRIDLVVFGVQVRRINNAERDNLRIGMGQEGLEKLAAAVAHPDEPKTNLVACAEHPGRGRRRRQDCTRGRGRHRSPREITAVETRGHGSCLSPAACGPAMRAGNARWLATKLVPTRCSHPRVLSGRCQWSCDYRRNSTRRYNGNQ